MYQRDHANCWNCNGWFLVSPRTRGPFNAGNYAVILSDDVRWRVGGLKTHNMICEVCGHNYMEEDNERKA